MLSTVLRYSGVWTLDGIHCLQKREVTLNLCHGPLQEMHGRQDIAYHKAVPCVYSALRVPMRSNARDHVTMKMATACLVAMATLDVCEPRNICLLLHRWIIVTVHAVRKCRTNLGR